MKIVAAIFLNLFVLFLVNLSHAFKTEGFTNPYGVAVDDKSGFIYVSNVNGDPNSKDDNGFISRLNKDGSVDQLKFIDGASDKIILHAPKGMTILGNFLYVCDLDALHAFDLTTGNQLFDVNFGELPHEHFYAITIGSDGALYVADSAKNIVYRIDVSKQHEVTPFITGSSLGSPHGIIWYTARQVFMVAGNSSGQVTVYDRSGKDQQLPGIIVNRLEGLAVDDGGNIYIASSKMNAVYRAAPTFALFSFHQGISNPSGVAYHRAEKVIIVTSFSDNTVQSYPVVQ